MWESTWVCPRCKNDHLRKKKAPSNTPVPGQFPGFVMGELPNGMPGLIAQCTNSECLFEDNTLTPASFSKGFAVPQGNNATSANGSMSKAVEVTIAPAEARQAPTAPAPAVVAAAPEQAPWQAPATAPSFHLAPPQIPVPAVPLDIIGSIQQRELWLGSEEARLEGLVAAAQASLVGVRTERKQLTKMLRASSRPVTRAATAAPQDEAQQDLLVEH